MWICNWQRNKYNGKLLTFCSYIRHSPVHSVCPANYHRETTDCSQLDRRWYLYIRKILCLPIACVSFTSILIKVRLFFYVFEGINLLFFQSKWDRLELLVIIIISIERQSIFKIRKKHKCRSQRFFYVYDLSDRWFWNASNIADTRNVVFENNLICFYNLHTTK